MGSKLADTSSSWDSWLPDVDWSGCQPQGRLCALVTSRSPRPLVEGRGRRREAEASAGRLREIRRPASHRRGVQQYWSRDHLAPDSPTTRNRAHDADRPVFERRRLVAGAQHPVPGGHQHLGDGVIVFGRGNDYRVRLRMRLFSSWTGPESPLSSRSWLKRVCPRGSKRPRWTEAPGLWRKPCGRNLPDAPCARTPGAQDIHDRPGPGNYSFPGSP